MVFGGLAGGAVVARLGQIIGTSGGYTGKFFSNPLIQGGNFGVGYTGGAYLGYGASNTWDPFSLHNKGSYSRPQSLNYKMPYGSYGRRRYSRYGSSRYSRYSGYRRYSRYRRRRPYYRRSYY
ncbi:MAG TPA: hypothetical protein EYN67_17255 [Flavobacteriales bacterium]|nr:hypothetical protein [Flavobacteriales bacterium]